MILHASINADDPEHTARTIARLLGGQAIPLGPTQGSWSAVGPDPIGNVVEVVGRGAEFHSTGTRVETQRGAPARHSGFHLLIESPLSEDEIMDIAQDAGVPANRSSRGVFGDLIEFWIDGCQLLEVLPMSWARAYRALIGSEAVRAHIMGRVAEGAMATADRS